MKVHILHDWFDTLRNLLCLSKLDGHDVKVWTDHEPDPVKLAALMQKLKRWSCFASARKCGRNFLRECQASN